MNEEGGSQGAASSTSSTSSTAGDSAAPTRTKRFSHPESLQRPATSASAKMSGQRGLTSGKKLSLPLGAHYPYYYHAHYRLRPDDLAGVHGQVDGQRRSDGAGGNNGNEDNVDDEVDELTASLERTVRKISRGGSPGTSLFCTSPGYDALAKLGGLSGLARGYEQYRESLLTLRPATEYGEASSDDLSSEWDNSDAENNNASGGGHFKGFAMGASFLRNRRLADNAYKSRSYSSPISLRLPPGPMMQSDHPDTPMPKPHLPLSRLRSEPLVEEEGDDEGEGGGDVGEGRVAARRKVRETERGVEADSSSSSVLAAASTAVASAGLEKERVKPRVSLAASKRFLASTLEAEKEN
jgi:hypothetical protein